MYSRSRSPREIQNRILDEEEKERRDGRGGGKNRLSRNISGSPLGSVRSTVVAARSLRAELPCRTTPNGDVPLIPLSRIFLADRDLLKERERTRMEGFVDAGRSLGIMLRHILASSARARCTCSPLSDRIGVQDVSR